MSELVLEKNKKLPLGWEASDLDSLSLLITKGSTPTTYGFVYQKSGINFIKVENIIDSWIEQKTIHEFIDEETNDYLKRSQLNENDILFSIAGTIGRTTIVRKIDLPANTNQAIAIIRCPWKYLNPKYVRLILDSPILFNSFSRKSRGVGIYNLSLSDIKELNIPIPPLNEQKRIVAKIEELFSLIDFSKQTLKETKLRLDLYRRSLLKKIFNKIPERVPLNSIAQINPTPEKNRFSDDLKVSFIPMKHVEELTGKIDTSITRKFKEVKKGYTFFEENDLLFAKITPCMENGKIALAQNLTNKLGFGSTEFHVIRFRNEQILSKFYFWYLIQDDFRNIAQRSMKGTAGQLRVSSDYIKNVMVPHTSKHEQEKIIIEIETSVTKIIKQEELISLSLNKINYLTHAILKQAFEGKLVPQDPNDEPAEILLEKIKQEKQKIINQTTRKKNNGK